jgi:hypothetical protein
VILYIGLALNRKQWLIAPIIGTAVTFTSALYSTTVYPVIPCGDGRCIVDFYPIRGGLPQLGFVPSPIIANIWFITDAVFYTLLALAILELVAGTRRYKSSSSLKAAATPHPGIAPRGSSEKNLQYRLRQCSLSVPEQFLEPYVQGRYYANLDLVQLPHIH